MLPPSSGSHSAVQYSILQYICRGAERPMGTTKTATLTLRIDPGLKEALRAAAQQEHRSIANMVEVLIRDYCEKHGIAIASPEDMENNGGDNSA